MRSDERAEMLRNLDRLIRGNDQLIVYINSTTTWALHAMKVLSRDTIDNVPLHDAPLDPDVAAYIKAIHDKAGPQ